MSVLALKYTPTQLPMIREQLKFVLAALKDTFQNNTFKVTSISSIIVLRVNQRFPSQPDLTSDLAGDLSLFMWVVSRAAGIWAELLMDQTIVAEDNLVDLHLFTGKAYKCFVRRAAEIGGVIPEMIGMVSKEVYSFLEIVSDGVCEVYNQSKKLVTEEIDELNDQTRCLRLMNKFIIYKLLKELHRAMHNHLLLALKDSVFFSVQPDTREHFATYIIQTYDILKIANGTCLDSVRQLKGLPEQFAQKLIQRTSHAKSVSYSQAISEDGEKALCLEIEMEEVKDEVRTTTYMVHVDNEGEEVLFLDPGMSRKRWHVQQNKETSIQNLLNKKNKLVEDMRGAPVVGQEINMVRGMQTIGGSLGSCLAKIGDYDSIGSFISDFSKKAILSSSLNFMISRLPILGYFLIVGGFSLSFYTILQNKTKSSKKKLKDIGHMFLGTSSSVGSGIIGGFVGAAFIPIPVLGVFIGSLIGGFIGGVSSNAFMSYVDSSGFAKMIDRLQEQIQPQGYWKANPNFIRELGFSVENFYNSIPKQLQSRLNCDNHWLTLIAFCMLSFQASKTHAQLMQRLMKIYDPKIHEQIQLPVSPVLEKCMQYLQKERIELRMLLGNIQAYFREMFTGV